MADVSSYFVSQDQAGVSAFENVQDTSAKRGASFYSLAALTPRNGSRLGKVWLHAPRLSTLLRDVIAALPESSPNISEAILSSEAVTKLDEYWDSASKPRHDEAKSPVLGRGRKRGMTESVPPAESPESHPASSVSLLLDSLGPLLFPLYRQALLRKRILIVRKPPMQPLCHFVYILSILSGLPAPVAEDRSLISQLQDLEPLFSMTIHDIPSLQQRSKQQNATSWIATSSDELLATKTQLFDIKVEFPPPNDQETAARWPTITTSDGKPIKATQRDLRHYRALRTRINALYEPHQSTDDLLDDNDDNTDEDGAREESGLLAVEDEAQETDPSTYPIENESTVAEPMPWAAIAYDSFIWWASAGERDADFQEERSFDQDLLDVAFVDRPLSAGSNKRNLSMSNKRGVGESFEMSVAAYFQRLTVVALRQLIEVAPLSEVSAGTLEESDGMEHEREGFVTKDDLIKMGFDIWSKNDRAFVQELARTYLGAEVAVQGKSVDCCGVRIV